MNTITLREAKAAAAEFIRRADRLLMANGQSATSRIEGSRLSGDVRRQSMELTRQLAILRSPY